MTNDLSEYLPPMLFGNELVDELIILPEYEPSIREMDAATRLLKLSDINKIFIPNQMVMEIYYKIYAMAKMSIERKGSIRAVKLLNANHMGKLDDYLGVATGMTAATCLGISGIGKTTSVQAAIRLLGNVIEVENPYRKIIPVLLVTTPFNSSFRSLCSQILARVDECLGTNYYEKSLKSTMNAEQVLQLVCSVANLYIGLLIIDEIQMIVQTRSGASLYRMVLQLINSANINVLMCGTPECIPFFEQNPQMARRTVGLNYGPMEYDGFFKEFCGIICSYQYVQKEFVLTDMLMNWLYEHSAGTSGTLVALIHDSQELAIINGIEEISLTTLNMAYENRLKMLHTYISPFVEKHKPSAKPKVKAIATDQSDVALGSEYLTIPHMVQMAKKQEVDAISRLKEQIQVVEVLL